MCRRIVWVSLKRVQMLCRIGRAAGRGSGGAAAASRRRRPRRAGTAAHRRGVEHGQPRRRAPRPRRSRSFGFIGLGRPRRDDALDLDDELVAQRRARRRAPRAGRLGVEHQLDEPGLVAEVDEHQPAVIAPARDPARDVTRAARVRRPQIAAQPASGSSPSKLLRQPVERHPALVTASSYRAPSPRRAAHSSSPTITTRSACRASAASSSVRLQAPAAVRRVAAHPGRPAVVHQRVQPGGPPSA